MQFKKNYKEVISRMNDLYSGRNKGGIYAKMEIDNPALEQYKHENIDGEVEYPDIVERADFWQRVLSAYTDLEDDSIPTCYFSEFDQGLYAGLVGAETRFLKDISTGWISSMAIPFISDLKEAEGFKLNEDSLWCKRFIKQLEYYKERAKGRYGLSHFIMVSGVNFLFELRGATNAYYDILENPEDAQKVIDFSSKLNIWIQNMFFDTIGLFEGGTFSNFAQWVPGRIISESLDPFHLTSVDMFEEWGKGQVQKMFDSFDGGVIHLHSNGHHLLESAAQLKGLKSIYLLDEKFTAPIYTRFDKLLDKRGDVPMVISIPYEIFIDRLLKKDLPSNMLYIVTGVGDVKTANLLMKDVKKYKI